MSDRTVQRCLLGLIVSLVLVGIVSGTPVRHLIQIFPAAIVLVAAVRRVTWTPSAALPVFAFWLLIMLTIWLFLLGISRFVTGQFTRPEIVLTFCIGVSSLWGLIASLRLLRSTPGITRRLLIAALFAVLQIGALWLSLQHSFSRI